MQSRVIIDETVIPQFTDDQLRLILSVIYTYPSNLNRNELIDQIISALHIYEKSEYIQQYYIHRSTSRFELTSQYKRHQSRDTFQIPFRRLPHETDLIFQSTEVSQVQFTTIIMQPFDIPYTTYCNNVMDVIYDIIRVSSEGQYNLPAKPQGVYAWLNHHSTEFKVNQNILDVISNDVGPYPLTYIYAFMNLTEDQRINIKTYSDFDYTYSHFYNQVKMIASQADIDALHQYIISLLTLIDPGDEPHIPGWKFEGIAYTPFSDPQDLVITRYAQKYHLNVASIKGLPQLVYTTGPYTIKTPPCNLFGLWPYHYITHYNGISILSYHSLWQMKHNKSWNFNIEDTSFRYDTYLRDIAYMLSLPEYKHIMDQVEVASDVINPEDFTYLDIFRVLNNAPHIIAELTKDGYISPEYTLTMGQREKLLHQVRYNQLKLDLSIGRLPYCIEDYSDIKDLTCYYNEMPSIDGGRFTFNRMTLKSLYEILEFQYDYYNENLNDETIVDTLEDEFKHSKIGQDWYYNSIQSSIFNKSENQVRNINREIALAYMGFNLKNNSYIFSNTIVRICAHIIYAGGLKPIFKPVYPFTLGFINYICDSVSKVEAQIIISLFMGISFDIINDDIDSINILRNMLIRGDASPVEYLSQKYGFLHEDIEAKFQQYQKIYKVKSIFYGDDDLLSLYEYITHRPRKYDRYVEVLADMMEAKVSNDVYQLIINKLGMIVPLNVTPLDYIKSVMIYMQDCINRDDLSGDKLDLLTDREIYDKLQVYIPNMISENRYLVNTFDYFEEKFFIPFRRHSKNTHFVTLPNETDLKPSNIKEFAIAYGTLENYNMYLLVELIWALRPYDETSGIRRFKLPIPGGLQRDGIPIEYDRYDDLIYLLEDIKHDPRLLGLDADVKGHLEEVNTLLEEIKLTSHFMSISNTDDINIAIYNRLSDEHKALVFQLLEDIFYMGMYFRQWKGMGYSFPHRDDETRCIPGFDPDVHTLQMRAQLVSHYTQASSEVKNFIDSLYVIEHNRGQSDKLQTKLGYFIRIVLRLEITPQLECIRMASTKFIGSAYEYVYLFTGKKLGSDNPHGAYKPEKLELVS